MCDGSYQPIETVQEGQWVLARDELTGEVACKEVVHPYANPDRSIILLTLQAEDGTTQAIETTDNHPFYVADRGWTRVDALAAGDRIPSADGRLLTVVSTLWTDRIETVYNFGVDGFHTYFVGESEAWVHNCPEIYLRSSSAGPRLHGKIPNNGHLREMRDEGLSELRDAVQMSLKTREHEMVTLGEKGGHGRRIGDERRLLRKIQDVLRDRGVRD